MRVVEKNMIGLPLLDYKYKYAGILLIFTAAISGYLYFFGGKPDWLVSKIFAVLTSYLETRTFVVAQTNLLDEIASIFLVAGNRASVSRDYRITTKGFQSVYEEGDLTIIDYDAKVGDTYTLNHNGNKLVRKVTKVSKKDEYEWGFMLIKTIHVEETGRNLPGVSKIEFIGNHRWGMVGLKLYFEDGSAQTFGIVSEASN